MTAWPGEDGRSGDDVPVLAPGTVLAPELHVLELLRRGRALDVYAVWSAERACVCVAKVARPDRSDDDNVRRRLRTEGRLLLSLTHPHLVRAYELVEEPALVLVLETLVGERLDDLLARLPRRPPARELGYLGLQLASALRYLHRHGHLLLDVKPDNVLIDGGLVRVIDLSLARPPGRAAPGIGTRDYLAPEQALGEPLTTATDVWGLGVTLYEAATGCCPFAPEPGHPTADTAGAPDGCYRQLAGRAEPVRALRPRLARPLTDLIDGCLEPDPGRRPTLTEAIAVLARLTPDPPAPLLDPLR
jgi:serine/threonine protein kinase